MPAPKATASQGKSRRCPASRPSASPSRPRRLPKTRAGTRLGSARPQPSPRRSAASPPPAIPPADPAGMAAFYRMRTAPRQRVAGNDANSSPALDPGHREMPCRARGSAPRRRRNLGSNSPPSRRLPDPGSRPSHAAPPHSPPSARNQRCRHRSSRASPPPRRASSISAGRAPPCSTGSTPATTAAGCCCASRTRTGSARPRRRSTRSSKGCGGSASIGTGTWCSSSPAPSATGRWWRNCSPLAAPTGATPARTNSCRCASRPAPRASRCATTGAGATAIPPRRPRASSR